MGYVLSIVTAAKWIQSHLRTGHGLPAGLNEVEIIERARAKRQWLTTLPPLEDTSKAGVPGIWAVI